MREISQHETHALFSMITLYSSDSFGHCNEDNYTVNRQLGRLKRYQVACVDSTIILDQLTPVHALCCDYKAYDLMR